MIIERRVPDVFRTQRVVNHRWVVEGGHRHPTTPYYWEGQGVMCHPGTNGRGPYLLNVKLRVVRGSTSMDKVWMC